MIEPLLQSISIRNFRSIQGEVSLPLDAPVVLLHGPNGAGKTSVLAALELAITGTIPSMHRSDAAYWQHLVHKDASEASITLRTTGEDRPVYGTRFESGQRPRPASGLPFGPDLAAFYSERCYLPQSRLGRLLDVYQHTEADADSALTRYVKDLLGLDHFDALIDGLHATGDIRNLRKLVPDLRHVETQNERANAAVKRHRAELSKLTALRSECVVAARAACEFVGVDADSMVDETGDFDAVVDRLNQFSYEAELQGLFEARVEVDALISQLADVASPSSDRYEALLHDLSLADSALASWQESVGNEISVLFAAIRAQFPTLRSPDLEPGLAVRSAMETIEAELARVQRNLARLEGLQARADEFGRQLGLQSERMRLAEAQLGDLYPDVASLARSLAALMPHVHSDECPVCGRDYGDLDAGSLREALSARIGDLAEHSERLEALSSERAIAAGSIQTVEQQLAEVESEAAGIGDRSDVERELANLNTVATGLRRLAEPANQGSELVRAVSKLQGEVDAIESANRRLAEVEKAISALRSRRGMPDVTGDLPLQVLENLRLALSAQHEDLAAAREGVTSAIASVEALIRVNDDISTMRSSLVESEETASRAASALARADAVRSASKELRSLASQERSATIRRVFNESLNGVWRDLFIRLAPNEPFVPTFRVPTEGSTAVDAVLETAYRSSGSGGSPSVMLSAGNLNTAALTLFMALHLSIEPRLPILVLDDPVQSMDEVHISQLAALMRTLTREHGRQIIIAVHERPLFEYLSLELTPAFEGDALITAEISGAPSSESVVRHSRRGFQPDSAIA